MGSIGGHGEHGGRGAAGWVHWVARISGARGFVRVRGCASSVPSSSDLPSSSAAEPRAAAVSSSNVRCAWHEVARGCSLDCTGLQGHRVAASIAQGCSFCQLRLQPQDAVRSAQRASWLCCASKARCASRRPLRRLAPLASRRAASAPTSSTPFLPLPALSALCGVSRYVMGTCT